MSRALVLFVLVVAALAPARAGAFGFGVGAELGGQVGSGALLVSGLVPPNEAGGELALVLSLELIDESLLRVQTLGRLAGGGLAVFSPTYGGAGGYGGGEVLLRAGLALPIVEPFLELGGGVAVGGGGGSTDIDDPVGTAVSGTLFFPAGYVGTGLTFQIPLPLTPYIELRVGTHVGAVLTVPGQATSSIAPSSPLSATAEAHLGAGFRF